MVETLVQSSKTSNISLALLVQCPEAIGANVQFLLSTLINERPLVDVRHKASVGRIVRVADAVSVEGTLAANIASLCHFKPLPFMNSADQSGQDNTTIVRFTQIGMDCCSQHSIKGKSNG